MGRECGGAGAAGDSLFQSPPRLEKKATALLGQSFLQRFATWSIDNERQVLVLKEKEAMSR